MGLNHTPHGGRGGLNLCKTGHLVTSCARRTPAICRVMVRRKLWKGGLLKTAQPHLRAKPKEDLACGMVNLVSRKHRAMQRLMLLLKNSFGIAEADFNRMQSERTSDISRASRAITHLKTELKRRGINL